MILHPLFHWSPAVRRDAIDEHGLRVGSDPVCNTGRYRTLCLSQSPSQAWALSAAVFGQAGQEWDCWQVTLGSDDEVEVRNFQGNRIEELRVRNDIPVGRLWRVGSRSVSDRVGGW